MKFFLMSRAICRGLFMCLCMLCWIILPAQEADSIAHKKGNMDTDFLLFELAWNRLLPNGDGVFQQQGAKSLHYGLGIFRQRVNLYRHRLGVEYGLGLVFDRYEWTGNYRMAPYAAFVTPVADTVDYRRNSLHITSLDLPLLLGFGKESDKVWHSYRVSVGGYLHVLMGTKTKRRAATEGASLIREGGSFNLPPVHYGIRSDVEWGRLGVFGKYAFSPFFKEAENGGYQMNAFTVGLRWVPF